MIKLLMKSTKLSELSPELVQYIDWKSLSRDDVNESDNKFVSENFNKFSTNLKKYLISTGSVNSSAMNHDQWIEFIHYLDSTSDDLSTTLKRVQLPYSVVIQVLYSSAQYVVNGIIRTQPCVPVEFAIKEVSIQALNDILLRNSNPAIVDYIQTPEGAAAVKKRGKTFVNSLRFLTSTESERIGMSSKNFTINSEVLLRVNACSAGRNYARRILKELNLTSITWDDVILHVRNNTKLNNRPSLREYIGWISSRKHHF